MKAKILILLIITLVINACSKEVNGGKPQLTFTSVNATTIPLNSIVIFNLTLKDATNGTTKDTLFVARKFYTCPYITKDTNFVIIPTYNGVKNQKANIEYTFQYGSGGYYNGCINSVGNALRTDSLNYYFWVKDAFGNTSDTVVSPKIILLK
ncbi:MAG: hypothetical protein QM541_13625 [Flavobacterium sp.]|nr:hypothetical protein [Flavobacterium sp.]